MDLRKCSHGVPHENGPCVQCRELNQLRAQVAAHEQSIRDLKARLSSALSDVSVVVKERDAAQSRIAEAENTVFALQENVNDLEEDLQRVRAEAEGEVERLRVMLSTRVEAQRLTDANTEVERLKELLAESMQFCQRTDGDGDPLNIELARRIYQATKELE